MIRYIFHYTYIPDLSYRVKKIIDFVKINDYKIFTNIKKYDSNTFIIKNSKNYDKYLKINIIKKYFKFFELLNFSQLVYNVKLFIILLFHLTLDLYRGKKIQLISVVSPFFFLPSFYFLKIIFKNNIKWIIDWNDIISIDENYLVNYSFNSIKKINQYEKKCFNTADINIVLNSNLKDYLLSTKYPSQKIVNIELCYDENDCSFESLQKINLNNPRKVNIGFLGNFNKPPKVPGFEVLSAFEKCSNEIDLAIHIIGDESKETKLLLNEHSKNILRLYPYMALNESLILLNNCDYLLLTLSNIFVSNFILHSKLPIYLFLKKPILAFVPKDSYTAQVIKKSDSGFVLGNYSLWSQELIQILKSNNLSLTFNTEIINDYNWVNIKEKWRSIL